ncbi:hypothetical protein PIB30_027895 [Stylosanthes scabra]|uniref:RNase H type-1 domain-containing protein n=1 Tax=Stylosanthes scabra TaxID=79078 RepID=A0ABU6YCZ1_9FABA|nr:hypothetical protein [Stylosanthes scabra]
MTNVKYVALESPFLQSRSLCLSWLKPPANAYKVNCDASIFFDDNCAGFGAVIRNDMGLWIKDCFGFLPTWYAFLAIQNSRDAFLAVQNPSAEDANLIARVHELRCRDWSTHSSLVPCEANRVADNLAKYGAKNDKSYVEWLEPGNSLALLIASEALGDQAPIT